MSRSKLQDDSDDEECFPPKTIKEVLDIYLTGDFESDLIQGLAEVDIKNSLSFLKIEIIKMCDLENNPELREECGSSDMSTEDVADVIVKAFWRYFNDPYYEP